MIDGGNFYLSFLMVCNPFRSQMQCPMFEIDNALSLASVCSFPERCSKYFARSRDLDKCNHPDGLRTDSWIEFDLHILRKPPPSFELPNPYQLLNNGRVGQASATILAPQDLRVHVVEGDGEVNIGIVFVGIGVGNDVRPQQRGVGGVDTYSFETDGNLGRCGGLLQRLFNLPHVRKAHFACSIDNDLRRVRCAQSQGPFVGCLSIGKRSRGVRILPSIMVPVVDVLTENDQLRVGYGLQLIQLLHKYIRRRATRAAFGGEKLDKNRGVLGVLKRCSGCLLRRLTHPKNAGLPDATQ